MVVDPVHFLHLVWSSQIYVRGRGKSYVHLFKWFSPKKRYPGESAEPMKEGKQGPGHPTVNFGALSSYSSGVTGHLHSPPTRMMSELL